MIFFFRYDIILYVFLFNSTSYMYMEGEKLSMQYNGNCIELSTTVTTN